MTQRLHSQWASAETGLIRISTASDPGRTVVSDAVNGFLDQHLGVRIEIILPDSEIDIVGDGMIDLALRFGSIDDSTLSMKGLGTSR